MSFAGSGEGRREEAELWDPTDFDGRREELLDSIQGLDALRRIVLAPIECDAAGSGEGRLELELRGSNFTGRRRDELAGRKGGVEAFQDVGLAGCKVGIVSGEGPREETEGEGPREETELRFDVRRGGGLGKLWVAGFEGCEGVPSRSELTAVRGVDALRPSGRPAPQTRADVGRAKLSEGTGKLERPLDALRTSLWAAPAGGDVLANLLRCADGKATFPNSLFQA